jgi:hypothetical protein
MKYIIELVLTTIIIFFVWNILKRIFYTNFYQFPPKNNPKNDPKKTNSSSEKNVKWDAETVDYEEVDKK